MKYFDTMGKVLIEVLMIGYEFKFFLQLFSLIISFLCQNSCYINKNIINERNAVIELLESDDRYCINMEFFSKRTREKAIHFLSVLNENKCSIKFSIGELLAGDNLIKSIIEDFRDKDVRVKDRADFPLGDHKIKILEKITDKALKHDIYESALCFYFERYHASLIYSLRAVERIVQVFAEYCGAKKGNGWGQTMNNMNNIKKTVEQMKENDPKINLYKKLEAFLHAIREWRNEAAHTGSLEDGDVFLKKQKEKAKLIIDNVVHVIEDLIKHKIIPPNRCPY